MRNLIVEPTGITVVVRGSRHAPCEYMTPHSRPLNPPSAVSAKMSIVTPSTAASAANTTDVSRYHCCDGTTMSGFQAPMYLPLPGVTGPYDPSTACQSVKPVSQFGSGGSNPSNASRRSATPGATSHGSPTPSASLSI